MIIIHGWITNVGYIEDAIKFSKMGIKCHLLHLSGFGYSGGRRANCSMKRFMKDIILVLKQIETDKPLFIYGDSLGAIVS